MKYKTAKNNQTYRCLRLPLLKSLTTIRRLDFYTTTTTNKVNAEWYKMSRRALEGCFCLPHIIARFLGRFSEHCFSLRIELRYHGKAPYAPKHFQHVKHPPVPADTEHAHTEPDGTKIYSSKIPDKGLVGWQMATHKPLPDLTI